MIKACLFDLDGTLLDTLDSIRYYLNLTLEKRGLLPVSRSDARIFVGNGAEKLVNRALCAAGIDLSEAGRVEFRDDALREYVDAYDANPFYLTKPYDGIIEAIDKLYERGILLAVISNKPDSTVKQLVKMHFGDKFSCVFGAREGVPLKPDPTSPLDICRQLGVKASEVAYFGDTGTDMQTGKAFGCALNVGVDWGFRDEEELRSFGADVVISHPSWIANLIFDS